MEKNVFCHQKRNTDERKMHFIPENTGTVTVMIVIQSFPEHEHIFYVAIRFLFRK